MIRREEIEKEAEEYASDVFVVDKIGNFGINMNEYDAFIDGAEWADSHPFHNEDVDLEKAIQQHINECLDIKFPTTDINAIKSDVEYTARMFFELGLKAQKRE